ncbi:Transposon TX1 uncharacterized 149 kDa protein [Linum perenne]
MFYKSLLCESSVVQTHHLERFFKLTLTDAQADELYRPVGREEIKNIVFSIPNEKSPRPDGYKAGFYKDSWNIVGDEVCDVISSFFDKSYMPPFVNSIALALIPKVKNADDIRKYRPISYCNVIYKATSKILVHRLASVLPSLISLNQTTFVNGRHIGDGILMAHELLSRYKVNGISPRCAMQIDLMKAFDSVERTIILNTLRVMNFTELFVKWIEACFESSRLSVKINGSLNGYFPAKKGFRQGDPISPMLFVMSMEILTGMFENAALKGEFKLNP